MANGDTMLCPSCGIDLKQHCVEFGYNEYSVKSDLVWCAKCHMAYAYSELNDPNATTNAEPLMDLADGIGLPAKVEFSRDGEVEELSAVIFSLWSIVLLPLTSVWLFITVFSFSINIPLALALAAIQLALTYLNVHTAHCRIALSFNPSTATLTWSKGPFKWLSRHRAMNVNDITDIEIGSKIKGMAELTLICISLKNKKKPLWLDFSNKEEIWQTLLLFAKISRLRGRHLA